MQESKTGVSYINSQDALTTRQMAIEISHPQGPKPLQFDNICENVILRKVRKKSKEMGT